MDKEESFEVRVIGINSMFLLCPSTTSRYHVGHMVRQLGGPNHPEVVQQLMTKWLDRMVDGNFDVGKFHVIVLPEMFMEIVYLSFYHKRKAQCDLLDLLTVLCEDSTLNISRLCDKGVITKLLAIIERPRDYQLNSESIERLVHLIGTLGSFRVQPRELKLLFRLMLEENSEIKNDVNFVQCRKMNHEYAKVICSYLIMMTRKTSPSSFFNFNGRSGGLVMNEFKFPKSGSISFCCWLRLESAHLHIQQPNTHVRKEFPKRKIKPLRIFSLYDRKNVGIDFVLDNMHFSLQTVKNGVPKRITFSGGYVRTGKWIHVCVTIGKEKKFLGLMSKGKVSLFLDGSLIQTEDFDIHSMSSHPLVFSKVCSGDLAPSGIVVAPFSGQLGPIAFFSTSLQEDVVRKMYLRGTDFQFDDNRLEIIREKLLVLYNPRMCGEKLCRDNSPKGRHHADVMLGTKVLVGNTLRRCICLIGGIEVVFPLLAGLTEKWTVEYNMCARVISLIGYLTEFGITRREVVKKKTFAKLALLLSKLDSRHMNASTLHALRELVDRPKRGGKVGRVLHTPQGSTVERVSRELFLNIFYNFELWSNTECQVQVELWTFLAKMADRNPPYFRKYIGIYRIFDGLRMYYGYTPEKYMEQTQSLRNVTRTSNFKTSVLGNAEKKRVRKGILRVIKIIIKHGVTGNELGRIVVAIACSIDSRNKVEVMKFLYDLLISGVPNLLNSMVSQDILFPFLCTLDCEDLEVRIWVLRVLGKLIELRKGNFGDIKKKNVYDIVFRGLRKYPLNGITYSTLMKSVYLQMDTLPKNISEETGEEQDCRTLLKDVKNVDVLLGVVLPMMAEPIRRKEDFQIREFGLRDINILVKSSEKNKILISANKSGYNWRNLFIQTITPFVNPIGMSGEERVEQLLREVVVPIAIESISLVMNSEIGSKRFEKSVLKTMAYIDMLKDIGGAHNAQELVRNVSLALFQRAIPGICNEIGKHVQNLDVAGNPFWKNLYNVFSFFGNYVVEINNVSLMDNGKSDEKKLRAVYIHKELKKLAEVVLIKMEEHVIIPAASGNEKMNKLLHYSHFGVKHKVLFPNIRKAVSKVTSFFRQSLPPPDFFSILFRLYLHMFRVVKEEDLFLEGKYHKRIMLLLHKHIPMDALPVVFRSLKIQQPMKNRQSGVNLNIVITDENDDLFAERGMYILSAFFLILGNVEDTYQMKRYVPIVKNILRKYRATLAKNMVNQQAKRLLTENIGYMGDAAPYGDFMFRWNTDWMPTVLKSEPIDSMLKAVFQEPLMLKKSYDSKINKYKTKILREINEKTSKSDESRLLMKIDMSDYRRMSDLLTTLKYEMRKNLKVLTRTLESMFLENGVYFTGASEKEFYTLDESENSARMRFRFIKNQRGTNYHENSYAKKGSGESSVAKLKRRKDLMRQTLGSSMIKILDTVDVRDEEMEEDEDLKDYVKLSLPKEEDSSFDDSLQKKKIFQKTGEKVVLKRMECQRIVPFNKIEGTIEITNKAIYFQQISKKERKDDGDPESKLTSLDHVDLSKFIPFKNVKFVILRRYLFQWNSVEIFLQKGKVIMLKFKNEDEVGKVVKSLQSQIDKERCLTGGDPRYLIKKSGWTQKWVNGECTNFEYLMALNTFASRSFNDISQYPVFPWILSDYVSKTLDLNDETVYRDLSKPVGALNESKVEIISKRYRSMDMGDIPKFHFGSHYSSVSVPTFFMIRIEPYTKYNLILQGDYFDIPDRLFNSVGEAWKNTQTQLSDVKELIPEFFFLPEMFTNDLDLDLGIRQDGSRVRDVDLPEWAGGSPSKFIRIHRRALESEYVSKNLHKWIDLIFGFKQRGKEAEKALNVFYYLTYEHKVKPLSEIEDPILRKSVEIQMSSFGQTPPQLFKKAHPQKKFKKKKKSISPNYWNGQRNRSIPFFELQCSKKQILFVKFLGGRDTLATVDISRKYRRYDSFMKPNVCEMINPVGHYFARDCFRSSQLFEITSQGNCLISCGHFNKKVCIVNVFNKMEVKQSLPHHDIVNCVKISERENYLVSGSSDCSVCIWKISEHQGTHAKHFPKFTYFSTFYGHESSVLTVDVSEDLDLVVSGDFSGIVKVFSLKEGKYIRTIRHPFQNYKINNVLINRNNANIVLYSKSDSFIYVFTVNGKMVDRIKVEQTLNHLIISEDSNYLFAAGNAVFVFLLENLQRFKKVGTLKTTITSISEGRKNEIVVGCKNGNIAYYGFNIDKLFERIGWY